MGYYIVHVSQCSSLCRHLAMECAIGAKGLNHDMRFVACVIAYTVLYGVFRNIVATNDEEVCAAHAAIADRANNEAIMSEFEQGACSSPTVQA
jgi:hypothetical protein